MDTIKEALTFDDVLLIPKYSSVLPSNTNISFKLTKKIKLKVPFFSSAMDTVTESKMSIAIAKEGGMGIIHRNLDIKKQSKEVKKVSDKKLLVGAAIGTNLEDLDRTKSLLDNGVDIIVIDTAHGHSEKVLKTLTKIKKNCKKYSSLCRKYSNRRCSKKIIQLWRRHIKSRNWPRVNLYYKNYCRNWRTSNNCYFKYKRSTQRKRH